MPTSANEGKYNVHSLWLMPDQNTTTELRALISELASKFNTPIFAPHITLVSDFSAPIDVVRDHCDRAVASTGPTVAHSIEVDGTTAPFMSVFLKVHVPDELIALRNKLLLALGISDQKNYLPHISLAYFAKEGPFKNDQIARLNKELREFRFNIISLDIVHAAKAIPISQWLPSASIPFPL
ncbi:MAG: 2'-5' RNA ligase family protein [Rhodospirillales bacterium]|jgi:2'-5' RNA ligase|nr:2'-5' RNA ligase family protein [Rhodospirillales bacterium]